jgi:hypothetical protein
LVPVSSQGPEEAVTDYDTPEEVKAKRFFGFEPHDLVDEFLLRSRKFDRDRRAKSQTERDLAQRYFELLAPQVGIKVAAHQPQDDENALPRTPRETADIRLANDPRPSAQVQSALSRLKGQLDHAINAEVIQSTISVYRNLFKTMAQVASYLGVASKDVDNATVRRWMLSPDPQVMSREQLREVLDLLSEDLHTSLGGTPEFNHPGGMYARTPESSSGLLFRYLITAIREKALERWHQLDGAE